MLTGIPFRESQPKTKRLSVRIFFLKISHFFIGNPINILSRLFSSGSAHDVGHGQRLRPAAGPCKLKDGPWNSYFGGRPGGTVEEQSRVTDGNIQLYVIEYYTEANSAGSSY